MQFATQEGGSNGQAALDLVVALMHVLVQERVITPDQFDVVVKRAGEILPGGVGRRDKESREVAASVKLEK